MDHFFKFRGYVKSFEESAVREFLKGAIEKLAEDLPQHVPAHFSISTCASCRNISLWIDKDLVYPRHIPVAAPNADLDEDIRALYLEASSILSESPRGAAALLRLSLQKLLVQLGKSGKDINTDIKQLVSEGLSPKIQQALDLLRVVGNHAVHPGQIDLDDKPEVASKLFKILNLIANELISTPRELNNLYDEIVPDNTKEHIKTRDGKNATG